MDCARVGLGLLLLTAGCFSPNVGSSGETEGDGTADETTATDATTPATMTSGPTDPTPGTDATDTTPPDTNPPDTDPGDTESPDTDADPSDTDPSDTDATDSGGPNCGDGNEDPDEACDDGNDVNGDGCNNNCVVSGTVLWEASYDEADDLPTTLAVDGDDNVLVLALIQTGGSSARFSNWQRTYDADGDAIATGEPPEDILSVAFDDGGDGFVAVYDGNPGNGDANAGWTLAVGGFSAAGEREWSSSLGGYHYASRVSSRPAGGAVVGGGTGAGGFNAYTYGHDLFLNAYDGSGSEEWAKSEDGDPVAACGASDITPDGDVVVACYDDFYSSITFRKYSAAGVLAWESEQDGASAGAWSQQSTSYQSLQDLMEPGLAINADGEIAFCLENVVLALDQNGGLTWAVDTTGAGEMTLRDVSIGDDGSVVVVGHDASDSGNDGTDIVVRKFDAGGDEQWSEKVDAEGLDDSASEVELASDGIVVYGVTSSGVDDHDLWLRKYAW